jgi:hypothetical protein
MNNPFAEYNPPPIAEVFSDNFKVEMLNIKAERLVQTVKHAMLEDGRINEFLDGDYRLELKYDTTALTIYLADNLQRLSFVEVMVKKGVGSAYQSIGYSGAIALGGNMHIDEENSNLVSVEIFGTRFDG